MRDEIGLEKKDAAFILACNNEHLEVVANLKENFGLKTEDVRVRDNEALRYACACSHLEVVEYLYQEFGLTADDA